MGADLLILHFCMEEKQDEELTRKALLKAIDVFDDKKAFEEWYETVHGEFPFGDEDYPTIEDSREDFREAVNNLFDCLGCRDVTWISHKGDKIWLTGGMSWGDSPTESYNDFLKFINLPMVILDAGKIHW